MSGPAFYDIAKISRSCFLNYNRKFKAQFKNFYKNQNTQVTNIWNKRIVWNYLPDVSHAYIKMIMG